MIENNGKKRREWIKNAAIIFLVIMLLLTFFSNTIMNYSLPEVSAQYVSSGTLSEQIRGTATVEAAESYNVKIDETRIISSVNFKAGDVIEKGAVIFTLEDSDSTELTTAQNELETLELAYKQLLLKSGADYTLDNIAIKNLEEDIAQAKNDLANIEVYQAAYEKAKSETATAQKKVDELTAQQEKYSDQITAVAADDYTSLDEVYYNKFIKAKEELTLREKNKTAADKKVEDIKTEIGSDSVSNSEITAKRTAIDKQNVLIENLATAYAQAIADDKGISEAKLALDNAKIDLQQLTSEYNNLINQYSSSSSADSQLTYAKVAQNNAELNYNTAKTSLDTLKITITKELKDKSSAAKSKLDDANRALKTAQENEATAKEKASTTVDAAEEEIKTKERDLETQKATLAQTQKKDLEDAGSSALDVESKQNEIEKKKQLVEKLKSKATGAKIEAQVGGTIDSISCIAGETVNAGDTIAVIQMTEKGCTASISVTNDQAKKVKVGDEAEVQYYWYGDAKAVLSSVKPDTANPTQKKQLVFSVTGDVTPGQSLQLVLGSKGQQYELLVPNSSIREDNNGKFVLVVVSKSSPLGNRYVAKRVDVQVVASDDTTSAVTGELMQSDFVISTSTKPIEAGMQVRLVDSN